MPRKKKDAILGGTFFGEFTNFKKEEVTDIEKEYVMGDYLTMDVILEKYNVLVSNISSFFEDKIIKICNDSNYIVLNLSSDEIYKNVMKEFTENGRYYIFDFKEDLSNFPFLFENYLRPFFESNEEYKEKYNSEDIMKLNFDEKHILIRDIISKYGKNIFKSILYLMKKRFNNCPEFMFSFYDSIIYFNMNNFNMKEKFDNLTKFKQFLTEKYPLSVNVDKLDRSYFMINNFFDKCYIDKGILRFNESKYDYLKKSDNFSESDKEEFKKRVNSFNLILKEVFYFSYGNLKKNSSMGNIFISEI